jgi:cytochrome c556
MKRLACVAFALAVLASAALSARPAGADDQNDPSNEKIMQALFKGPNSAGGVLKTELKGTSPSWPKVQEATGKFAKLAPSLQKNEPHKGELANFQQLAKAFAANAKALDDAAQKEDLTATKAAYGKIGASCKVCHGAHRE